MTPSTPDTSRRTPASRMVLVGAVCLVVLGVAGVAMTQSPPPAPPAPVEPSPVEPSPVEPSSDAEPIGPGDVGRDVEVVNTDGSRVEGQLKYADERVLVIESYTGGDLIVPRTLIGTATRLADIETRYLERRARLAPSDSVGRLQLALYLRERRAYGLALREAQAVVGLDPFNREAAMLEKWLKLQIELGLAEGKAGGRDGEVGGPGEGVEGRLAGGGGVRGRASGRPGDEFPLLTPEEINLIRVYELDLSNPPRMSVGRGVVDRLIEGYPNGPDMPRTEAQREALRRAPPARVLDQMFRARARELYGLVTVHEDPQSIATFRQRVHNTWLMNACATTECHGGAEAGRLYLNSRGANRTASVYTNLLILDQFKLRDGRPLIDYENPEASPLLQMGLDRREAATPHPNVATNRGSRSWRPIFRDPQEIRFREAADWIRSMYRPRPDVPGYGLDYQPPQPTGTLPELPDRPVGR